MNTREETLDRASDNRQTPMELSDRSAMLQTLVREARQHLAAGRLPEAEFLCKAVLTNRPILAEAAYIQSLIAKQSRRNTESIALLQQAIVLDPTAVCYHFELGVQLQDAGRFEEALAAYENAVQLQGNLPPIHNNKGNVLKLLGRFEEAAASYAQAAALSPDSPEIRTNMGVALADQRRLEGAEQCFRKALELKADHASAHWNLGLLLLLKGTYAEGWREYEWRWRVPNYAPFFMRQTKPRWRGESLAGRTILLHSEQGLGDTLQFIRYAPLVAERGGRVIVQCQAELVKFLSRSGSFGEMIGLQEPAPAHDVHCSLMSLPFVFGTTLASIPCDIPYLFPEKDLVSDWGGRMDTAGLKVGLVWAGKLWEGIPAAKSIDRRRSISLSQMAKLGGITGLRFYSLQLDEAAKQVKTVSGISVIDLAQGIRDFRDTAAIIANLDLVISVDTSVAHLAGAMGKPVWILSRFDGCWRWLLDREDSPWYPSMRLFRQTSPGDWETVIERIAGALCNLVEADYGAKNEISRSPE